MSISKEWLLRVACILGGIVLGMTLASSRSPTNIEECLLQNRDGNPQIVAYACQEMFATPQALRVAPARTAETAGTEPAADRQLPFFFLAITLLVPVMLGYGVGAAVAMTLAEVKMSNVAHAMCLTATLVMTTSFISVSGAGLEGGDSYLAILAGSFAVPFLIAMILRGKKVPSDEELLRQLKESGNGDEDKPRSDPP